MFGFPVDAEIFTLVTSPIKRKNKIKNNKLHETRNMGYKMIKCRRKCEKEGSKLSNNRF